MLGFSLCFRSSFEIDFGFSKSKLLFSDCVAKITIFLEYKGSLQQDFSNIIC